jgi:hypothetical protein
MKGPHAEKACLNKICSHCNGCSKRQRFAASAEFDEWAIWQASGAETTQKAEDVAALDCAIEVATLAG